MKIQEARALGDQITRMVTARQFEKADDLLSPVLAERTPFRMLDAIGAHIHGESAVVCAFLEHISRQRTMGGWVVIASALRQQITEDLPNTFEQCCNFVDSADVWYATDIFGERLPGPALVEFFEPSVALLASWRESPNRWIRRMIGVAIHYWAKQARGAAQYLPMVHTLLDLLEPVFTERDQDAIKGIGWGMKTLGKYYPDQVSNWLIQQAARPHRALMLRKAITYLPPELRQSIADIS